MDLNITKVSIKKRIMQGMRMILVGMSQAPPAPNGVTAVSKSCSEILIKWDNIVKNNLDFPVHKYIIQRHVVQKLTTTNNKERNWYLWEFLNETSNASHKTKSVVPSSSSSTYSALHSAASWVLVFEGSGQDNFFEDHNLERETRYRYRIISWNAVGHSNYVYIDTATTASPCILSKQPEFSSVFSSLSFLFELANFLSSYIPAITLSFMMVIFPYLPPSFKVYIFEVFISLSTYLSQWIPIFAEVTNTLREKKEDLEIERDYKQRQGVRNSNSVNNTNKIRHNGNPGNGLRKCGSRDGFNSDGSDDLNGGVRRSGSESSLGGSFSDDDYTCSRRACYICKTKFGIRKVYNARTKHVCKVCGKCFCKDCGTTNHLEFQSCKVPSTCTCCRCQGKLDQTPKVAKENGLIGIALKAFKKGLKNRGFRTELDDLGNATCNGDRNEMNYDTVQQDNAVQIPIPSMSREPSDGRPPRPTNVSRR